MTRTWSTGTGIAVDTIAPRLLLVLLLSAWACFGCSSEPDDAWLYINAMPVSDGDRIEVPCGSRVEIGVLNRESSPRPATIELTTTTFVEDMDNPIPADPVQLDPYPTPFTDQLTVFVTAPSGDACPNSTGVRATIGPEGQTVTVLAVQ